MLIPLIALGIPVFDTVLSSMRRFITGKQIFGADKEHVHHRLISLGLNTRRAVLLMYAMSIGLCLISLFLVNVRDERASIFPNRKHWRNCGKILFGPWRCFSLTAA